MKKALFLVRRKLNNSDWAVRMSKLYSRWITGGQRELVMRAVHIAIMKEDLAGLKTLLQADPSLLSRMCSKRKPEQLDVWEHALEFSRSKDHKLRHLEDMVLLLLEYGYPVNHIPRSGHYPSCNQAWHAVSTDMSSLYLLRCYTCCDGYFRLDPSWAPPLGHGVMEFGPGNPKCDLLNAQQAEKLALLKSVWENWTPAEHKDFPRPFKAAVFTLLLIRNRQDRILRLVPRDVFYLVVRRLACVWCEPPAPFPIRTVDPAHWRVPIAPPLILDPQPATQAVPGEKDGAQTEEVEQGQQLQSVRQLSIEELLDLFRSQK